MREMLGRLMASLMVAGSLLGPGAMQAASAAPVTDFSPGNIISDDVFFDAATMSGNDIQAFLTQRTPTCSGTAPRCLKEYSETTRNIAADAYCAAYRGWTGQRAADIIHDVAQACGVNPQVLLVMLQKEQGLVNKTAPTVYAYERAMGFGCPDGRPCNAEYFGLFNQLYNAARQFKLYRATPTRWRHAAGRTVDVSYHPNTSCGTAPVTFANAATAGLYNYTPYQPNEAALAAGFGQGDSCSAYGNRNFHLYFTQWFGSPLGLVRGPIGDKYKALGGRTGFLGQPRGTQVCGLKDGGCYQVFDGGQIHWSPATGAWSSRGAIQGRWSAGNWENGPLGYPLSDEVCGLKNGGCLQRFEGGEIHWSSASGARWTYGPLRTYWADQGFENGALGYPTTEVVCGLPDGGCYQIFQGAKVSWTSTIGARRTTGAILTHWGASGYERGTLGYPISEPNCTLISNGCVQLFQRGQVHWSAATGAATTRGTIAQTWGNLRWERGPLGYPIKDASCATGSDPGCSQSFAGGSIVVGADRIARPVYGAIVGAWRAEGALAGRLGAPTSGENCGLIGQGCFQYFAGGQIHWSPATGAYATLGSIAAEWGRVRWERGPLGYPTSRETCGLASGGCFQHFAGGDIHRSAASGTWATYGGIRNAWASTGWERGYLGYPTGPEVCAADRSCSQNFQGGSIVWRPTGAISIRPKA